MLFGIENSVILKKSNYYRSLNLIYKIKKLVIISKLLYRKN